MIILARILVLMGLIGLAYWCGEEFDLDEKDDIKGDLVFILSGTFLCLGGILFSMNFLQQAPLTLPFVAQIHYGYFPQFAGDILILFGLNRIIKDFKALSQIKKTGMISCL